MCFKSQKRIHFYMKRKLEIFQYGSQFDPTGPTRYSPSDWIEISVSESSPSEGSCSIGAPRSPIVPLLRRPLGSEMSSLFIPQWI